METLGILSSLSKATFLAISISAVKSVTLKALRLAVIHRRRPGVLRKAMVPTITKGTIQSLQSRSFKKMKSRIAISVMKLSKASLRNNHLLVLRIQFSFHVQTTNKALSKSKVRTIKMESQCNQKESCLLCHLPIL